jgi:uncharacterized protein YecE (DUF72 family)
VPRELRHGPAAGIRSQLERYSSLFDAVEINSTFYRAHRSRTFERWARSVPEDFRFTLKLPREISHKRRLVGCADLVATFLDESAALGEKRAVLLLQLPPSFSFDPAVCAPFFEAVREQYAGKLACEPRHPTWFGQGPSAVLCSYAIARVAADPAVVPEAAEPAGGRDFVYYRLHGSPRTYYSGYSESYLSGLRDKLETLPAENTAWCIFDNTALGAAAHDGLALRSLLSMRNQVELSRDWSESVAWEKRQRTDDPNDCD